MKPEQLPADTKSKLDKLLRGVEQALKRSRTPHTRAVSGSWMAADSPTVLNGGDIAAPCNPQFDYDTRTITELHKALLRSGDDLLFGVVVHASRSDAKGRWELKTKLVSRAEYGEVEAARKPIDTEVERELRRLTEKVKWERVSYGTRTLDKSPELIRRANGELQRLEARPELIRLFPRAQEVYKSKGLDLLTAIWTLRPAGLEFNGYWE
jgi:hypothetical protein